MNSLSFGFTFVFIAALSGGVFGLQYRIMRKYTVENSALLTMIFATLVVPLIAVQLLLPGWTHAICDAGLGTNLLVFLFGFGWGMGAITFAYGVNILGMALAVSILQGINVAVGSGIPLARHWDAVPPGARTTTVAGLLLLLLGAALAGIAGRMRERQHRRDSAGTTSERKSATAVHKATGVIFLIGLASCLASGLLSACANLGYEFASPLENAMGTHLDWRATLIRWMPMYWGGIAAMLIVFGATMIRTGSWRNYFAPGTGRDCAVSSAMGIVHFMAQIPYGVGAYYLGTLGTTIGWGANIGMALIVSVSIGFVHGEWRGVSKAAVRVLYSGIAVLLVAIAALAYGNSLM